LLTPSPCGSGADDPTIGDPLRVATRGGSFLMEQPHNTNSRQYKVRAKRASNHEGSEMRGINAAFDIRS